MEKKEAIKAIRRAVGFYRSGMLSGESMTEATDNSIFGPYTEAMKLIEESGKEGPDDLQGVLEGHPEGTTTPTSGKEGEEYTDHRILQMANKFVEDASGYYSNANATSWAAGFKAAMHIKELEGGQEVSREGQQYNRTEESYTALNKWLEKNKSEYSHLSKEQLAILHEGFVMGFDVGAASTPTNKGQAKPDGGYTLNWKVPGEDKKPDENDYERYPIPICMDEREERGALYSRKKRIEADLEEWKKRNEGGKDVKTEADIEAWVAQRFDTVTDHHLCRYEFTPMSGQPYTSYTISFKECGRNFTHACVAVYKAIADGYAREAEGKKD